MLNEAPKKQKKQKDYAHPSAWALFWRIQKECLRRSVTVFLMYLFLGLLMLACQAIDTDSTTWTEAGIGLVCLLGGMAFDAHLCFYFGSDHYDAYCAGLLHRRNELFGMQSGGNHRPEREFRFWKGFLIGFYAGLLVLILGLISGAFEGTFGGNAALLALTIATPWAVCPLAWIRDLILGVESLSYYWSCLFALIPILVSGIFYIVGAMRRKAKREEEAARAAAVEEAAQKAKEKESEPRVQTEEQRKKTMQSKAKKKKK